MKLEMQHAEVILELTKKNPEKASKIIDGEILDTVDKATDMNDFKDKFQKLIDSK